MKNYYDQERNINLSNMNKAIRTVTQVIDGCTFKINKPLDNGLQIMCLKGVDASQKEFSGPIKEGLLKRSLMRLNDLINNKEIVLYYNEGDIVDDNQCVLAYVMSLTRVSEKMSGFVSYNYKPKQDEINTILVSA